MDPNNHSPQSELDQKTIASQPDTGSDLICREESTPTPPSEQSPQPEKDSSSISAETLRMQALQSELQEKEQLVTTLTEQLEQVIDKLDHNQNAKNGSTDANHLRLEELETELLEKEQLVKTLKERLGEVAEQLQISERTNEELTAAENLRVKELETELQEKEQLVAILTERLEQVAEQLDRRHRTGADRGMTISGGIPPEVIEEQHKLSQDLQSVLEQWQGMETENSLSRIELQISELKQMVEAGFENGVVAPKPSSLVEYLASPTLAGSEEEPLNTEEAELPEEPSVSASEDDSSASGWEEMKAKLLSGQGVSVSSDLPKKTPPPPPPQQPAPHLKTEQSDTNGRSLGSYKPALPDAPAEIDQEQASQDQLIQAIRERDQYISLLIKRVREAETAVIPVNWEQLNSAPEELLEKLQSLHHDLEHNLGMAEVEISIERARLSRTESMLQNREAQIRKKEKQLGLNLERTEELVIEEDELDDERKKSWLGFLN